MGKEPRKGFEDTDTISKVPRFNNATKQLKTIQHKVADFSAMVTDMIEAFKAMKPEDGTNKTNELTDKKSQTQKTEGLEAKDYSLKKLAPKKQKTKQYNALKTEQLKAM